MPDATDILIKYVKATEEKASTEVSKSLSAQLNDKKTRAIVEKAIRSSVVWPPGPQDKQVVKQMQLIARDAWAKMANKYGGMTAEIEIVAVKGKPVKAHANVTCTGDFKGGESVVVKKGETMLKLAKKHYGDEEYAALIWEENEKSLGAKCDTLVPGTGLAIPLVWIPDKASDMTLPKPKIVKAKVEPAPFPNLNVSFSEAIPIEFVIPAGTAIYRFKGSLTLTGELGLDAGADFTLETDSKSTAMKFSKVYGDVTGGFGYNVTTKKGSGGLSLKVFNSKIGPYTVSASVE